MKDLIIPTILIIGLLICNSKYMRNIGFNFEKKINKLIDKINKY